MRLMIAYKKFETIQFPSPPSPARPPKSNQVKIKEKKTPRRNAILLRIQVYVVLLK